MTQKPDNFDSYLIGSRLSMRQVFLMALVLGLLIPAVIITVLSFNLQRERMENQLAVDQKRLLDIVALGMQEPLWNLSRQAGAPLVSSVMDDPRVISIRVSDTQSNTVFLSTLRSERRIGSVAFVQKDVVYRGEAIGQVSIEFDTEHLAIDQRNQLKNLLMIVVAQLLLSVLLIMTILHSRFLRPIRQLSDQATQLAALKLDEPFHWGRHDEIGTVGKHLEWMRAELKRLIDELKSKTLALEADIERRREVEDALRRSENKYRELFWSNLDGIVIKLAGRADHRRQPGLPEPAGLQPRSAETAELLEPAGPRERAAGALQPGPQGDALRLPATNSKCSTSTVSATRFR